MKRARSIRFKLITLYVCLLTLVFLCFGAYIYLVFRQLLVSALNESLYRRASQIAVNTLDKVPKRGTGFVVNEIRAWYAPERNERVIRITDSHLKEIYASDNAGFLVNHPAPISWVNVPDPGPRYWEMPANEGEIYRFVGLVHRLADGESYLVEVGSPVKGVDTALEDLVWTLLLGFPVLITLAIFGGYSLLGRALHPVDEIVGAAEQITFKDRNQRLPVPATGDEFERISEALNRMLERLDESYQIANRFAGDASHELRTPLTILQGELEAFINDPSFSSEAIERAGNMLEEVVRLNRIIEGLLLVSRLDAGEAHMKQERVRLDEIVRSVGEQMQLLCEEKSLRLQYEVDDDIVVEGDDIRLRQIVVNLLDNAIKYTPQRGVIRLRVGCNATTAFLEVIDTGMGISASALPQVFERFFRSEEARAARTQGTGLGLAIVKSIAEAHGGHIRVESGGAGGTKIRIELALAEKELGKSKGGAELVA